MKRLAISLLVFSSFWSAAEISQYAMQIMNEPLLERMFSHIADFLGINLMYIQFVYQLEILRVFVGMSSGLSLFSFRFLFWFETVLLLGSWVAKFFDAFHNGSAIPDIVFLLQTVSLVFYELFHNWKVLRGLNPLRNSIVDNMSCLKLMKVITSTIITLDVLSWISFLTFICLRQLSIRIQILFVLSSCFVSLHILLILYFNHQMKEFTLSPKLTTIGTSSSKQLPTQRHLGERTTVLLL